jgi:hypothetical protein
LIKKLLESGRDVIALDSLWTGSVENIRDFEKSKHFAFIKFVIFAYSKAIIFSLTIVI